MWIAAPPSTRYGRRSKSGWRDDPNWARRLHRRLRAMLCFQGRLLSRAIEIAGGVKPLCLRLGADEHSVKFWMEDKASMPARVFLIIADLVLEDDIARASQDRRQQPRGKRPTSRDPSGRAPASPP